MRVNTEEEATALGSTEYGDKGLAGKLLKRQKSIPVILDYANKDQCLNQKNCREFFKIF